MNDKLVQWKQDYLPRILNNADRVIAVGMKLAEVLESKYQIEGVKVVPNYIDVNQFKFKPNRSKSEFRFLFVGGLDKNKGIVELVHAFHQAQMKGATLHIVGSGMLEKEIRLYLKNNHLKKVIHLHGNIPNHELSELYNASNVCVSVSEYETFGIAILEAMSCGLPILYTASGGPDDMVKPFAGIKIPERTISGIMHGLIKIKKEYESFDSAQIRQYVIDHYSAQHTIGVLLDEYKIVLDEQI